jgi:hypothetical protein
MIAAYTLKSCSGTAVAFAHSITTALSSPHQPNVPLNTIHFGTTRSCRNEAGTAATTTNTTIFQQQQHHHASAWSGH